MPFSRPSAELIFADSNVVAERRRSLRGSSAMFGRGGESLSEEEQAAGDRRSHHDETGKSGRNPVDWRHRDFSPQWVGSSRSAPLPYRNGNVGGAFPLSKSHPTSARSDHTESILLSPLSSPDECGGESEVSMTIRRIIVLTCYSVSMLLSVALFFFSGVYCQVSDCSVTWAERNRQYAQIFPMAVSCLIFFLSATWLVSNYCYVESSCLREYSALEMPTSVTCSLLAGISAVIEIHFSFDYSHMYWSEQWTFAAADAVAIALLHAGIVFALV